jgi:hypothetical protein
MHRDKVNEIFRSHPKNYIAKMDELGFEYFEDVDDCEEYTFYRPRHSGTQFSPRLTGMFLAGIQFDFRIPARGMLV